MAATGVTVGTLLCSKVRFVFKECGTFDTYRMLQPVVMQPCLSPLPMPQSNVGSGPLQPILPHPVQRNLETSLAEMFTLCTEHDFVFDYLFHGSAEADLSVITSPYLLAHAVTKLMNIKQSCGQYPEAAAFNGLYSRNLLSIPCFNVSGITLGLAIEEMATSTSPELAPGPSIQFNKYARDMYGTTLHVRGDEQAGIVSVLNVQRPNGVMNRIKMASFPRSALRAATADGRRDLLAKRLKSHVMSFLSCDQSRSCPKCDAPPTGKCGCVLKVRRPSHPQDLACEAENITLNAGSYFGISDVELYSDGRRSSGVSMLLHSVVRKGDDIEVLNRLQVWGIQNRTLMLKMNPINMIMPALSQGLSAEDSLQELEFPFDDEALLEFTDSMLPDGDLLGSDVTDLTDGVLIESLDDVIRCNSAQLSTPHQSEDMVPNPKSANVRLRARLLPKPVPAVTLSECAPPSPSTRRLWKNRECAARSNQKRREGIAKLRSDLEDTKVKAERLSDRLASLQELNLMLKESVKERGIAAP